MVLELCGKVVPRVKSFWDPSFSAVLQETSHEFLSKATSPLQQLSVQRPGIHVLQGEIAQLSHRKEHVVLSSSEATTCILVGVFSRTQELAALAHLDSQTCTAASVAALCRVSFRELCTARPASTLQTHLEQ